MLGLQRATLCAAASRRSLPAAFACSAIHALLRRGSTAAVPPWNEVHPSATICESADVEHVAMEAPTGFMSVWRPPKSTARKWVSVDATGGAYATGRRKKAIARVWLWPEHGEEMAQVKINMKNLSRFFNGRLEQRSLVLAPFFETRTAGNYSVLCTVKGGGVMGQAEAVRLGIATALQCVDASVRPKMKRAAYLKRDARQRERKKPGQKGARKKFAWVKR